MNTKSPGRTRDTASAAETSRSRQSDELSPLIPARKLPDAAPFSNPCEPRAPAAPIRLRPADLRIQPDDYRNEIKAIDAPLRRSSRHDRLEATKPTEPEPSGTTDHTPAKGSLPDHNPNRVRGASSHQRARIGHSHNHSEAPTIAQLPSDPRYWNGDLSQRCLSLSVAPQ